MSRLALTNYHIKLLAALFMVIDHVGYVLVDNNSTMRLIGRLSFPLFAWLLVQGEAHTRNIWRYGIRLLIFAVISQPIYQYTFQIFTLDLNILFTLLIGLACLRGARRYPSTQLIIWVLGAAIAQLLRVNYGAYGIGVIALIRFYRNSPIWWSAWVAVHLLSWIEYGASQFPAVITPGIFMLANHQLGPKARWFYLFYPVHLAILWYLRVEFIPTA
ncbi:TraX family protein [Leptolyngbya sp. AN02str]|uniref:TraX family protein n=1 Tax=Leptolyngbya sp. AN02str TaxID=3423363 RepID=UPI003D31DAA0